MKPIITCKPGLKTIEIKKSISLSNDLFATVEAIVRDKQGNITDYRKFRSESFVANFLRLLWLKATMINTPNGSVTITDTGGAPRTCYMAGVGGGGGTFKCSAAIGAITSGIVVGTGIGVLDIAGTALGTIILHDAAPPTANRLQYSAVTFGAPANDAATSQFRITRAFANSSGGAITVNECGLYVQAFDGAIRYIMAIRDLTGGIAVPNGQTLTLNYQIQATVPGFVKQFIQLLYLLFITTAGVNALDIGGNVRALDWATSMAATLAMQSAPGSFDMVMPSDNSTSPTGIETLLGDTLGIQVGSNITAPNANDTAMNTRIVHGAAGLYYGGTEIEAVAVAAPSASFLLRRYFTNKSGGNITVREVGIQTAAFTGATFGYLFLIARDALAGDVVVADTELLRVQYTIQVTV